MAQRCQVLKDEPPDGTTIKPGAEVQNMVLHMHKDIMHTHSYWGPIYVTVMATLEVSRRKPNSSGGRTPQLG